ncbi:MAG: HAD family phosphatase [Clostridia bacterium]|nr:HAD family phosphatase [Clostridia bacterium]
MIRNIVCDMGGVLIAWDPPMLVDRLDLPAEDKALLLREVFRSVDWVSQDRGVVPQDIIVTNMCRRLPKHLHRYAADFVYGWWKAPFVPIEGIDALLHELKANGYTLYVLSNASRALHDYLPRLPGSDVFSGLIVSADWGILKPDLELYRILFREYGLNPAECYFIDDFTLNVEAARTLGMHGSVFDGNIQKLRRELAAAGVTVSLE